MTTDEIYEKASDIAGKTRNKPVQIGWHGGDIQHIHINVDGQDIIDATLYGNAEGDEQDQRWFLDSLTAIVDLCMEVNYARARVA